MQKIRITKKFTFEAAHILKNYDGPCRNVHGHSYKLDVTVFGFPDTNANSPKEGMVMDFGDLKRMVNEKIIKIFDHSLVVKANDFGEHLNEMKNLFGNIVEVPYQPTCENMLIDFVKRINSNLPKNITLHSLTLWETANSYAEWFAEDNMK